MASSCVASTNCSASRLIHVSASSFSSARKYGVTCDRKAYYSKSVLFPRLCRRSKRFDSTETSSPAHQTSSYYREKSRFRHPFALFFVVRFDPSIDMLHTCCMKSKNANNYPIDALTTPLLSVVRSVGSLTLHAALRTSHPGFVTAIVRELPNNGATVNNGRRCPIISFRSRGNRRRDPNLREPLVVISVAPIDTLGRCTIKPA